MYVHINKATSMILKCSPAKPRNTAIGFAKISDLLGKELLGGDLTALKDYFVLSHPDGEYTLEQNEQVSVIANKRCESTELVEVTLCSDPDFTVVIDNTTQTLRIQLNRIFNISAARFVGVELASDIERCVMYFSKKNDPTYLLFLVEVPLNELLIQQGNTMIYPLPVACQSVSVYTKHVLNSYSLEIM